MHLHLQFARGTSDLREGIMRNLRLLIADQSRFAAVTARRADGSARRGQYRCRVGRRAATRPTRGVRISIATRLGE
jgi:hypothetical protein